jgi:hypothetical protein
MGLCADSPSAKRRMVYSDRGVRGPVGWRPSLLRDLPRARDALIRHRCGSRYATRAWCATRPVYLALAVHPDGTRGMLGLWIEQTEGGKLWMKVFSDLRNRGVHDILIAVTDGVARRSG